MFYQYVNKLNSLGDAIDKLAISLSLSQRAARMEIRKAGMLEGFWRCHGAGWKTERQSSVFKTNVPAGFTKENETCLGTTLPFFLMIVYMKSTWLSGLYKFCQQFSNLNRRQNKMGLTGGDSRLTRLISVNARSCFGFATDIQGWRIRNGKNQCRY